MAKIVFKAPGRTDPGYLRRTLREAELRKAIRDDPNDPERLTAYIRFLAEYVADPGDADAAFEALLDASEEELEMLGKLTRGGRPLSAGQNGTPSG